MMTHNAKNVPGARTERRRMRTAGVTLALVAALGLVGAPVGSVAYADPATELAAASQQLDELGAQLSDSQSRLAEATTQLENTDYQISEKQADIDAKRQTLSEKQAALGEGMKSSYKSGPASLLDFILGSTSAEDLANRVYYLDKVSESQASAIEEVRTLTEQLEAEMSELEAQQASQQQQVDDLQSQVDAYQSQVAAATELYNSLDAEVQAQLAAQQDNSNVSTAIDAVENGQGGSAGTGDQGGSAGGDQGGSASGDQTPSTPDATPDPDPTPTPEPTPDPEPEPEPDPEPSVPAGGGLATAYAQLGKPYVYGATGPNAFDCSGLICYSYGYARGRTTYSMIASLQATGDWKTDISQLSVGDLVFPHSGHVGIYLGNNTYLHASNPTTGVIISQLSGFIGGGSYY